MPPFAGFRRPELIEFEGQTGCANGACVPVGSRPVMVANRVFGDCSTKDVDYMKYSGDCIKYIMYRRIPIHVRFFCLMTLSCCRFPAYEILHCSMVRAIRFRELPSSKEVHMA